MRSLVFAVVLAGCSGSGGATPPSTGEPDASSLDALADVIPRDGDTGDAWSGDKAAGCACTFGSALTNAYGRADGTVVAVVPPAHPTCAMPNGDHLVVQIEIAGGVHRMVLNVQSDRGADPRVRFASLGHPLPAPAWSPGWHTGVALDYASTLDAHVDAFEPFEMGALSEKVADAIPLGAPVSVYAWSSGGHSAHKIHRNSGEGADGAIVIDASGPAPKWLLFHFDGQTF